MDISANLNASLLEKSQCKIHHVYLISQVLSEGNYLYPFHKLFLVFEIS